MKRPQHPPTTKPEEAPPMRNPFAPMAAPPAVSEVEEPSPRTPDPALTASGKRSSLTAAAARITQRKLRAAASGRGDSAGPVPAAAREWQQKAWDTYDLVGEERFLANVLAGRTAQARIFVGQTEEGSSEPEPVDDPALTGLLDTLGAGFGGFKQVINRLAINLFVAGEGWLVGIPEDQIDPSAAPGAALDAFGRPLSASRSLSDYTVDELEWRMLSVSEVVFDGDDSVQLSLDDGEPRAFDVSQVYLIRVWRPHPRRAWEPDSPTRSSLAVLRELMGLTMHIGAQIDSRLAGAGILVIPQSVSDAMKRQAGIAEDSPEDPFTEALIETMVTPIDDRSSAAAVVPLVVTAPDSAVESFQHITFSTELDKEARDLRDEAIRRLALGQDAPPELLLGTADVNHWSAWLVREDVVTTHIEPPLGLICDALTTQFLRPVMEEMGYDPAVIARTVVWYDVSQMIVRPDRSKDASTLYDKGVIRADVLRNANGFDENDAPSSESLPPARALALQVVKASPALLANPGLDVLVEQFEGLLSGGAVPGLPEPAVPASSPAPDSGSEGEGESPAPSGSPGEPPNTSEGLLSGGTPPLSAPLYYPAGAR